MRRRALLAVALLCAAAASAQTIDCNQTLRGTLAAGATDARTFVAAPNQTARVVFYPLSSSLTHPAVTLAPPSGAPLAVVRGGKGVQLENALPSAGPFTITAGSGDAAASGDYLLQLTCRNSSVYAPSTLSCIRQWILCGQTIERSLSPTDSCRFTDQPATAYEFFAFFGRVGEVLSLEVESDDFSPRINIYPGDAGGSPIERSIPIDARRSSLTFVNQTGWIDIAVASRAPAVTGRFKLTVHDCDSPGCLQPVIAEPPDVAVPFGAKASLRASAVGIEPPRFIWSDRSGLPPVPVGEGPLFVTPPITMTRYYSFSASAPCMAAESRVFVVSPGPNPRRRAAKNSPSD